jgi:hypothetical protein
VKRLVNVSDEVKQPNEVKRLELVGSVGRDGFPKERNPLLRVNGWRGGLSPLHDCCIVRNLNAERARRGFDVATSRHESDRGRHLAIEFGYRCAALAPYRSRSDQRNELK